MGEFSVFCNFSIDIHYLIIYNVFLEMHITRNKLNIKQKIGEHVAFACSFEMTMVEDDTN